MSPRHITMDIVTDADQNATVFSEAFSGRLHGLSYVKIDFANGVDFAATLEKTGEAVWAQSDVNASVTKYPRVPVHDEVGADATSDGTRKLRDAVRVCDDRVKIVIAQGGAVKSGTVILIVD